jgi:hypothetical protein
MESFRKLLQLSKYWNRLAMESIDEWSNSLENDFV